MLVKKIYVFSILRRELDLNLDIISNAKSEAQISLGGNLFIPSPSAELSIGGKHERKSTGPVDFCE